MEQISKQAILEFLNKRLEARNNRIEEINSMECSTQSEKSYRMYSELTNYSKIELLEDLIGNIDRGMFDNQPQPTKIGFDNIEDAIDYYWEPSVNPNGSYEIDYELGQNEQSFCENEGFDWEDWKSTKAKKVSK
jgi:hypothetical protein